MDYKFPTIRHIEDVLPYVKDLPDFIVADKQSYIVINYVLQSSETFRHLTGDSEADRVSMIRRECRGIIFDAKTLQIIRRPFHKFFNVGEREETISIDLNQPHHILHKLDGSMIAPFRTSDGVIRIGTKMGETDVSQPVLRFLDARPNYMKLIKEYLTLGMTPIFEWMSPANRVVIDYGMQPNLVLLAARDLFTGQYVDFATLVAEADRNNVDVVPVMNGNLATMQDLLEKTRGEVGLEGYVVRYADGHAAKIKSDWYVAIHKAKDKILYERYVLEMVLGESVDDVKPYLLDDDRRKLEAYTDQVIQQVSAAASRATSASWQQLSDPATDRKTFALQYSKDYGAFSSIIFRHFDDFKNHSLSSWSQLILDEIRKMIIKNCNSNSKLLSFKQAAGLTFQWNHNEQE